MPAHGTFCALGFKPSLNGILKKRVPARQHQHGIPFSKFGLHYGATFLRVFT